MANLTATITLSAGTDIANDSLALTQTVALPVQPPSANIGRVDVTTGAPYEIRAASVATNSYVYIKNLHASNAINIRTAGGTVIGELDGGEWLFFPAKASVGIEVIALSSTTEVEFGYWTTA